jgi:hypothetical protein
MSGFHAQLKELYLNKSECVINLPEWLLPAQKINDYRRLSRLAIVEVAGRDSVAAAIKAAQEEEFTDLIPTYAYTGTECGPWLSIQAAIDRLAKRLPGLRIHDLLVLGSPGFWRALNGRFVTELIAKYGFYTPRIGCHVYLHSVRIPLALLLGKVPIISGERERHDKSIKPNQVSEALRVYGKVAEVFGVKLLFPLRHVAEGHRIEDILGFNWQEGKGQLGCVLSANYRRLDGGMDMTVGQIRTYLENFAYPLAKKIIEGYAAGSAPNHLEIAAEVLGS